MIRIEFWHDGEFQWYWQADHISLWQRFRLSLRVIKGGQINIHTSGDAEITKSGIKYHL